MKKHLLNETSEEIVPLQITHNEEDPSNQNHGLVPNFAARWRAIWKTSHQIIIDKKPMKKQKPGNHHPSIPKQ